MKIFGIALLLASTMFLAACGSSSGDNMNGNWTTSLTPTPASGDATALVFTEALVVNANQTPNGSSSTSTVSATNLNITTNNGCFGNDATQVATFTSNGTTNSFSALMQGSGSAGPNNILSLQGTMKNGVVSGTWTLYPVVPLLAPPFPCNGSGTFIMKKSIYPPPVRVG